MPAIPWRNLAPVDPSHDYLVMASRLPLLSHLTIPRFVRLTVVVARQLERSRGLVGYSLLAQPIAKTFWTLSAWQDQQSLTSFAATMPHLKVTQDLRPRMGPTTFTHWNVPGLALPVRWPDAMAHLDAVQSPA
jgi:hypothetical protein